MKRRVINLLVAGLFTVAGNVSAADLDSYQVAGIKLGMQKSQVLETLKDAYKGACPSGAPECRFKSGGNLGRGLRLAFDSKNALYFIEYKEDTEISSQDYDAVIDHQIAALTETYGKPMTIDNRKTHKLMAKMVWVEKKKTSGPETMKTYQTNGFSALISIFTPKILRTIIELGLPK